MCKISFFPLKKQQNTNKGDSTNFNISIQYFIWKLSCHAYKKYICKNQSLDFLIRSENYLGLPVSQNSGFAFVL